MTQPLKTTTSTQLLEALLDPGEQTAWSEFDHRYRPIIFRFACSLGLDQEAAAEIAQESLVDFLADYQAGKYDREKGRLQSWIIGIARNRVASYRRAQGRRRDWRRQSALDNVAEPDATKTWDDAQRQTIVERGLDVLRAESRTAPKTIDVFVQVALQAVAAEQVAQEHELTVAEVYRIKYRLTKRLRDLVGQLELMYSAD